MLIGRFKRPVWRAGLKDWFSGLVSRLGLKGWFISMVYGMVRGNGLEDRCGGLV